MRETYEGPRRPDLPADFMSALDRRETYKLHAQAIDCLLQGRPLVAADFHTWIDLLKARPAGQTAPTGQDILREREAGLE